MDNSEKHSELLDQVTQKTKHHMNLIADIQSKLSVLERTRSKFEEKNRNLVELQQQSNEADEEIRELTKTNARLNEKVDHLKSEVYQKEQELQALSKSADKISSLENSKKYQMSLTKLEFYKMLTGIHWDYWKPNSISGYMKNPCNQYLHAFNHGQRGEDGTRLEDGARVEELMYKEMEDAAERNWNDLVDRKL